MHPTRVSLLSVTLLLGGCASPSHQQLGVALTGLEGELQRLEEELAAMNGLHYQKAIDAPLSLRRMLATPAQTQGACSRCSASCRMGRCSITTTGCRMA